MVVAAFNHIRKFLTEISTCKCILIVGVLIILSVCGGVAVLYDVINKACNKFSTPFLQASLFYKAKGNNEG